MIIKNTFCGAYHWNWAHRIHSTERKCYTKSNRTDSNFLW